MHKMVLALLLLVSLVTLEVCATETMLAPPARPREFKSPNELRRYLKALNEYYAIVGRPRFGKRGNGEVRVPDFFRSNGDAEAADSMSWGEY